MPGAGGGHVRPGWNLRLCFEERGSIQVVLSPREAELITMLDSGKEIVEMQKPDQIALWAAKLENLESGVLEELQEDFERGDNTEWGLFQANTSQDVVEVKVKEEEEEEDDEEGHRQQGELKFFGGALFQGRFSKNLKNRHGKLYKDERSVKYFLICWLNISLNIPLPPSQTNPCSTLKKCDNHRTIVIYT